MYFRLSREVRIEFEGTGKVAKSKDALYSDRDGI